MIEHSQDVIPLLLWLIVAVGSALLGLLVWIGRRLQSKVDELPSSVSAQVVKVHDALLEQMKTMNDTHTRLEKDVREQITALDRRVVILEVRCELNHDKPSTWGISGK